MANLQIKGIDDALYQQLKEVAEADNRSVSQQVVFLIRNYLSNKKNISNLKSPAQTLLELSGSWEDGKTADDIIREIRKARKNSKKLREGF